MTRFIRLKTLKTNIKAHIDVNKWTLGSSSTASESWQPPCSGATEHVQQPVLNASVVLNLQPTGGSKAQELPCWPFGQQGKVPKRSPVRQNPSWQRMSFSSCGTNIGRQVEHGSQLIIYVPVAVVNLECDGAQRWPAVSLDHLFTYTHTHAHSQVHTLRCMHMHTLKEKQGLNRPRCFYQNISHKWQNSELHLLQNEVLEPKLLHQMSAMSFILADLCPNVGHNKNCHLWFALPWN